MLKVVGASWLQTRISTYILVAVALLGIGAVIFGEFGHVENDGTYSATVWWKRRTGFRIDFWGQGNDLASLPVGVARAYCKTGILETGWSILEIETSPDYPDDVQAYAAGLLEGSLTWQLIHHHWYNTVRAACAPKAALCRKMRHYLRKNADATRSSAAVMRHDDPYWHMIHLYYKQLDGLAEGWRFAVQRNRLELNIEPEDFIWLAAAADLPDLERALTNRTDRHVSSDGMLLLKSIGLADGGLDAERLVALAHNTAAPYAKMLRLIKRYEFPYRKLSQVSNSAHVPGRSIAMTSYPGSLSSQDESYAIKGQDGVRELIVAGTPLIIDNRSLWSRLEISNRSLVTHTQVLSAPRIMAANRLATDGLSWSRFLDRRNSGSSSRQWIAVEPRAAASAAATTTTTSSSGNINSIDGSSSNNIDGSSRSSSDSDNFGDPDSSSSSGPIVSLIEQIPGYTQHTDYTGEFRAKGYMGCTGAAYSKTIRELVRREDVRVEGRRVTATDHLQESAMRAERLAKLQVNASGLESIRALMRGEIAALNSDVVTTTSNSNDNTEEAPSDESRTGNHIDDQTDIEDRKSARFAPKPPSPPSPPHLPSSSSSSSSLSSSPSKDQPIAAPSTPLKLPPTEDPNPSQLLAYRGDLAPIPRPIGVIDTKLFLLGRASGLLAFEARSGPPRRRRAPAYDWASSGFRNSSHLGQPERFGFEAFTADWAWQ